MDIAITLLILALCLVSEAFFSGSEIGVVSADRIRLRHEAARGSRGAKIALKMLNHPEQLLSTTLIGTNISVVTNTTISTALAIELFGERYAWLAVVIVAPLIWIFGEIVAKSVFQQRADVLTPRVIFVLRVASILFWPILFVFGGLTRLLARGFGDNGKQNPYTLREEIASMMEMSATNGDIAPSEKKMIRRVFNFSETTAGEIFVPLIDVLALPNTASCKDARRLALRGAHKRLPVFEQRIDKIVGCINVLDLLRRDDSAPVTDHIRPVLYAPPSMSIETLLTQFREGMGEVAVVMDEFGGAKGIVMLEDILEVIVGELEDEFDTTDETEAWIKKIADRHYLVGARIELKRLKTELGLDLPAGSYQSLAGFLMGIAEAIPRSGTVIKHKGISFTIERGSAARIQEIRIAW